MKINWFLVMSAHIEWMIEWMINRKNGSSGIKKSRNWKREIAKAFAY